MGEIFNTIFYQPLLNTLIFLWHFVAFKDLGVAIILLTILIRLVLFPLFQKSARQQTVMQRLAPEIKKIQQDHKNHKEKQAQALMGLYRQHKVNPLGGFMLILVQLPIIFAVYRVILKGFSPEVLAANLYSFIPQPIQLDQSFLGLIDLSKSSIFIIVLAAIGQYFQGRLSLPSKKTKEKQENQPKTSKPALAEMINKQMVFIGPLMTIFILGALPSAVGLYWLTTTLFSLGQQVIINKQITKDKIKNGTTKYNN